VRGTTGVGSLPHLGPAQAAAFATACSVPYLPQLPVRHGAESMLRQWGDGLCGCGPSGTGLAYGVPAGPLHEAFVGAAAALERLGPGADLVKTQATGPITLGAAMRAAGHPGPGLWECVTDGLIDRIGRHLATIREQAPSAEIVLMLDEPTLGVVDWAAPGGDAALRALQAVMERSPVPAGLHCCGDADWGPVCELAPAFISSDIGALGPRFVASAPDLAREVSSGTRIIWGAVPADHPPLPSVDTLVARVRRAEGVLVLAGADGRVLDEAWLSPACGLAGLTVESAERVAARLDEVAGALR
jgi:methionine synthase II (cobalamin-independent)